MKTQIVPFWLVWRDNGPQPTMKHKTLESAKQEAERLARTVPGAVFYVVQPVSSATKNDVLVVEYDADHIPF